LAKAAHEAKAQDDPDLALESFIGSLPAITEQGPRLDLNPRRLNLGTLHVGDVRQARLAVVNQGEGLLHGTLAVIEGNSWLQLAEGKTTGECAIRTSREQQILLRIDTRGLAAPHKYAAKLTVITNGGIVEVPVRLDLSVHPFSCVPFRGVASPREMADLMRVQSKAAAPLLESGEVARWFTANGWTYPVSGPCAKGIAAVQQFFEGMGLSKPPTVRLAEEDLHLTCLAGQVANGQVILRTDARKWIYARAESESPWLRVTAQNVSGPQQTLIPLEADSRDLLPGQAHAAALRIVANAGQLLTTCIRLEVHRSAEPPARRLARPLLVCAVAGLLFRLLFVLPVDIYARVLTASPESGVVPGSLPSWIESPLGNPGFLKHFVVGTWWVGAVIGAAFMWRRGTRKSDIAYGLIAGGVTGLACSATLGCFWPAVDSLPTLLWQEVAAIPAGSRLAGFVWLWTPVWIAMASACWMIIGGFAGFIMGRMGSRGARYLAIIAAPISWLLRSCGLRRAAAFLGLS
jgi:hypothetical protein